MKKVTETATLKKHTDKISTHIPREDVSSLSVCLRDSAHGPYTFGTHQREIFQSVLHLQFSETKFKRLQRTKDILP